MTDSPQRPDIGPADPFALPDPSPQPAPPAEPASAVEAAEPAPAGDSRPEPAPAGDSRPEPTPLTAPAGGVPTVTADQSELSDVARALADGRGPVALDAERASGYRYGQRAYLVQVRREGAGSFLIDPIALPDLRAVDQALTGVEWVLHAATQDIPCLAEVGLSPGRLFDTELGARLAGLPKVGLSAVLEHYLGITLAKEHSAVDWSTRPLPEPWLLYAALDVELLVDLRDAVADDLQQQGKTEWAAQEFEAEARFTGPAQRTDPWRRTSGMHRVRSRRVAAHVRALWQARDRIAQQRDVAPGRVLPDATLIDLAVRQPGKASALVGERSVETGRSRQRRATQGLQRYQHQWLEAIAAATKLSDSDLPDVSRRSDAPPPARAWAEKDPVAAARLAQVREALAELSEQVRVPVENLLTPETLRRSLWTPPEPDEQAIRSQLAELGARPWQRDLVGPLVLRSLHDHPDAE